MQNKYTIPTSDIAIANARPLHDYLATLSPDWREVFGHVTIDYTPPDGPDGAARTSRYWRTAIACIPWLPFVLNPRQSCITDIVVAQLPRSIRETARLDLAAIEQHVRAVLGDWNAGIVVIALVAGVESDRLTKHMDVIACNVLGQLGARLTVAE